MKSRASPLKDDHRRPARSGVAILLLMVAAFALSAWKIASRDNAPDFAFSAPSQANVASDSGSAALSASPASASASTSASTTTSKLAAPTSQLQFDANFVSSSPGQAVHAASLVELENGNLRAVWFSGSREGAGDVTIQSAVMRVGAFIWEPEKTLFERHAIEQGLWRYVKKIGNPVIARAADGSLVLWMVNVSLGGWAGSSISWARSTDEGESWTQPRRLVTSPFLNISTLVKGAPFLYANGDIGLPVYHEFVAKLGEVLRVDPQGRVKDKIRISHSQSSLQPVVLITGSTTAQAFMRSGSAIALMTSRTTDAGLSWSSTVPSRLPNPDAAVAGLVSSDKRRWLALNPTTNNRETLALAETGQNGTFDEKSVLNLEVSPTPGRRLSIADYETTLGRELKATGASDSEIKAYVASARRQLCNLDSCAQEFSYPYLLQSRDGYLHLVYTWHRTRIRHIRLNPNQTALSLHAVTTAN